MDQPSTSASIAYLKSVLGIDSFILPEGAALLPEAANNTVLETAPLEIASTESSDPLPANFSGPLNARFVIVVQESALTSANRELLSKMVQAMKQNLDRVLLITVGDMVDANLVEQLRASQRAAVLVFGLQAANHLGSTQWTMARWHEPRPELPTLVTYGLEEVGANVELKRVVWQHLQMAMQRLG